VKKVFDVLSRVNADIQSCLSWEKPMRTLRAFVVFQVIVFFFEPFMVPLFGTALVFAYPVLANNLELGEAWPDPYEEQEEEEEEDEEEGGVEETLKRLKHLEHCCENAD
jgi:hypothetical protein